MLLKKVIVEHIDNRTGFVLKKIVTSEWEQLNRKLSVNNSLFSCELARLRFEKPILKSPFQIQHIRYDIKGQAWDFNGIPINKTHANKQNRFYFVFQQRSEEMWDILTWAEAENNFQDIATRGLPFVPYNIPLKGAIDDWKARKEDAESILNKSQTLIPIFCSKHKREYFEPMFAQEFRNSKLIGIQCYSLNDPLSLLNLTKVKILNLSTTIGQESPLILGLNHGRMISSISNVSGAFAYACFGCDILSERQTFLENMPPDVVKKIVEKKPDDVYRYDTTEGGFNFSEEQEFWNGINMTRAFLENVSLNEGLTPFQAIQWANFNNQQEDLELLNEKILKTRDLPNSAIDFVRTEKSRWASFWQKINATG